MPSIFLRLKAYLPCLFAAGLLLTGAPLARAEKATNTERHNLRIFDAAWKIVDQRYYDRNARRADWAAIGKQARPIAAKATDDVDLYMNVLWPTLEALGESHFSASPPKPHESSRPISTPSPPSEQGPVYQGMGFAFTSDTHQTVVIEVENGSPIERADIAPGDKVVRMKIHWNEPSDASFEGRFRRSDGTIAEVAYRWAEVARPPFAALMLPSGRLLLRFDAFDEDSVGWVLGQLRTAPNRGVVLDLRRNDGGLVVENQKLLGALLGDGVPIGISVSGKRSIRATKGPKIYFGPLAVLIGAGSGSAAEITADVLQHYGRAALVGERTAGQVLTSREFDLPGGGVIQIPVADYLNLEGKRLEGVGVSPSHEVRQTLAAVRTGRDAVVEGAEAALDATPDGDTRSQRSEVPPLLLNRYLSPILAPLRQHCRKCGVVISDD